MDNQRHQAEILKNLRVWRQKKVLRELYRDLQRRVAGQLAQLPQGITAELGSGIGSIVDIIPGCLRTDQFANPWIDQEENAYRLTFASSSVANLILIDVFHHLQYPGNALDEFQRVLMPAGRLILLEPCVSLLGLLVYGLLHPEPLGLHKKVEWFAPKANNLTTQPYYAAQGNVFRIFGRKSWMRHWSDRWRIVKYEPFAAIGYVLSGGYSRPQLFPDRMLPLLKEVDKLFNCIPALFATRLLVVLEKANPRTPTANS